MYQFVLLGTNVMPFCYEQKGECQTEKHYNDMIAMNCPPVYDAEDSCPTGFRCGKLIIKLN